MDKNKELEILLKYVKQELEYTVTLSINTAGELRRSYAGRAKALQDVINKIEELSK